MADFAIKTEMVPAGDQPAAIAALAENIRAGREASVLLGVTGSGKTFTVANVIEEVRRPVLIVSHNKTLAAQLYEEFSELFPDNAVEYFVSYYDYYQPEAYIPQRDIYIEKDASRNDDLDRLRLSATTSLSSRRDVIIVASVSAVFSIGSPAQYRESIASLSTGEVIDRNDFLYRLVALQYDRSDADFRRGTFRVRGDTVDIYPAYEQFGYQVAFFGDEVETIHLINPVSGEIFSDTDVIHVFPAVHYVVDDETIEKALVSIEQELELRIIELKNDGKLLEAHRLEARTRYDMEMMKEVGYCGGIENYSRHLDGRMPGEKPYTLLDHFGDDFLVVIDESHVTIPQLRAMYNGDRARKEVLIEHGFRLPSALDNRPLTFDEFEEAVRQVIFVSATPAAYEIERAGGGVIEQIVRPTGLVDPPIEVRPAAGQVPDLLREVRARCEQHERCLVTTLTKRLAEELAGYFRDEDLRCRYLHSEIDTLERVDILRDLREGVFDVLVGVNLLREGLDLPEVSLVAILDADTQGFLRSATSLVQIIGRCARNVNARVFLYADSVTPAMRKAMDETTRRRARQLAYNREHGIVPETIVKPIRTGLQDRLRANKTAREAMGVGDEDFDVLEKVSELEKEMLAAAEALEFERAAALRDRVAALTGTAEERGTRVPGVPAGNKRGGRRKKKRRRRW